VVYENLAMEQLEHHLEKFLPAVYSVSLSPDWQNHA